MANTPSLNKTCNSDIDGLTRRANRYIMDHAKASASARYRTAQAFLPTQVRFPMVVSMLAGWHPPA